MNDSAFLTRETLAGIGWRGLERAVVRLLIHRGFTGVRLIGESGDRGADVLAHRDGRRWAVQVKHWRNKVGEDVVDRTIEAARTYEADIPAIAALSGFTDAVYRRQARLLSEGIGLQLWTRETLVAQAEALTDSYNGPNGELSFEPRAYQETAIQDLTKEITGGVSKKAIIVMATGLGKTSVAADAIRRARTSTALRVLCLAHTNDLVYQLERSFWQFLRASETTVVWNQHERPDVQTLATSANVFASHQSLYEYLKRGGELPPFDLILIDEAHHVGAKMYDLILEETQAGKEGGPFLLGLTATPWRPDDADLEWYFGPPLVTVDLVTGMKKGFLSNVDYRMYTDNIDWDALANLEGQHFSPKQINKTMFVREWDDGVLTELQRTWHEVKRPRAIVFCETIEHALRMRDRINSLKFCRAEAIYSGSRGGKTMSPYERNFILSRFHDGRIDVVCAVDIFNEGVDVPDVNLIVFQRVTHSRRIFVQQLGRGLRIAEDKEKVVVLDFVSDIRRFAAGISLDDQLATKSNKTKHVKMPGTFQFREVGGEDLRAESFLREWLEDVAAVESADEDASVLKFPPPLPSKKR